MYLKMDKNKKEGAFVFSWKDIWIILRKRKLTLSLQILDNFIAALIQLRYDLQDNKKDDAK